MKTYIINGSEVSRLSVAIQFWIGTVQPNCFVLLSETPFKDVLDTVSYLHAEQRLIEQHGDDWFCGQ
ncbi:hypothetical protein OR235_004576 [Enterobacter cloacae]|nr:hypothetical protein [Enterobacter cloacae]